MSQQANAVGDTVAESLACTDADAYGHVVFSVQQTSFGDVPVYPA